MEAKVLISLIILSVLSSFSNSLPVDSVADAIETLSNSSSFMAIALTLEYGSETLIPESRFLTVFSPSDFAFESSGQPSLSFLQYHFSPQFYSLKTLKSLPTNAKIPTLSPNRSLFVTSTPSDDKLSLNGIKVDEQPIYDDGSLIIFGIDNFFDQKFVTTEIPLPDLECIASSPVSNDTINFDEATKALKSRGYAIMASFLDLQLMGKNNNNQSKMTVFAPVDEALEGYLGYFNEYASIFRRHVVGCMIKWEDLDNFNEGTVLNTYLEGFKINVTKLDKIVMLNKVAVKTPSVYFNDWLVVHGISEVLQDSSDKDHVIMAKSSSHTRRIRTAMAIPMAMDIIIWGWWIFGVVLNCHGLICRSKDDDLKEIFVRFCH